MCLQFTFTVLQGTRSSLNTFKISSRIPRKSSDSGLESDCNKLNMCTPAASEREYHHTAPPRATRSRVLAILADRTYGEDSSEPAYWVGSTAPQYGAFRHAILEDLTHPAPPPPMHVKNYTFKKNCRSYK